MELKLYLDFLRRRWWLLVLGPLLAGLVAYAVSKQMTPVFRATATVLVNQTQVPGSPQYNDVLMSERLTTTYAELVQRRPVMQAVIDDLDLVMSPEELAGRVSVATIRNTTLLRISAEDHDPAVAAKTANAVATAFIDDNGRQPGNRPGTVSIAEEAIEPGAPAKPNLKLNAGVVAVMGLVLAGGLAMALEHLDDTVKSPEDIQAATGLSALGAVARFRGVSPDRALAASNSSVASEAYRQVRTNVDFSMIGAPSRIILVTSPGPGEGKTTTAANLAVVLAQAGSRVALIDADLRRPSQHTVFRTSNSFGLTGLMLSGPAQPLQGLLPTTVENLRLLPSGPTPPNPSELLMSAEMKRILEQLRSAADYVVIDSPPILAVADASILAARSDGTLLVVEAGKTRTDAVRKAREALERANAKVLGVVINKVRSRGGGYYRYGYSGYYGHERSSRKQREDRATALETVRPASRE